MDEEERQEFERWNEEHGYTEDDYLEFDMDDVVFEDGGMRINMENYPEVVEQIENPNFDDEDFDDDVDLEAYNEEEVDIVDDTIHCLTMHQDAVISVRFSPVNSNIVASGGCDDNAFITDVSLEEYDPILLEGHTDSVNVHYSHDGRYLATAGLDAIIRIWDDQGTLLHTLEGASEAIEHMSWHKKGPIIAAGGGDSLLWLWNASSGDMMGVFAGHDSAVILTAFSGDNKKIISASETCIKVWNPKDSTSALLSMNHTNLNFHQEDEQIISLTSHHDRNIILSGGMERMCLINIDSGKVLWHLDRDGGCETSCFNENFPVFTTGDLSGAVTIYDFNTQQQRLEVKHDDGVVKVQNIKNTQLIASSSLDGTIRIWDPRNGEEVQKFEGHRNGILDMDTSFDGNFIVSGSDDTTVRIFDRRADTELEL